MWYWEECNWNLSMLPFSWFMAFYTSRNSPQGKAFKSHESGTTSGQKKPASSTAAISVCCMWPFVLCLLLPIGNDNNQLLRSAGADVEHDPLWPFSSIIHPTGNLIFTTRWKHKTSDSHGQWLPLLLLSGLARPVTFAFLLQSTLTAKTQILNQ